MGSWHNWKIVFLVCSIVGAFRTGRLSSVSNAGQSWDILKGAVDIQHGLSSNCSIEAEIYTTALKKHQAWAAMGK